MEVRAHLNSLRISPRKVRLVIDQVRGLPVAQAMQILHVTPKRSAEPVRKLIASAIANAKHNFKLDEKTLYVKTIFADEGVTLKRFMPASRGRANQILKRTSHITVILDEKGAPKKPVVQATTTVAAPQAVSKAPAKAAAKKPAVPAKVQS